MVSGVKVQASDLEGATKAVALEVAKGNPGIVITTGPAGFAMLCAAPSRRVVTIDGGAMIAFGFDRRQLAAMRARIDALLRGA